MRIMQRSSSRRAGALGTALALLFIAATVHVATAQPVAPPTAAAGLAASPARAEPAAAVPCPEATGAGAAVVRDSASFAAALRTHGVARAVLTASITLSPADFPRSNPILVRRAVTVLACGAPGSVELNLGNNLVARVVVGDGGFLAFKGPALRITSAPPVMRHPLWPDYNALLLGLVEVDGSGTVALNNLTVVTPSPLNATALLARYPPSLRPDFAVGPAGGSVVVRSWNLTQAAYQADGAADTAVSLSRRRLLADGVDDSSSGASGSGSPEQQQQQQRQARRWLAEALPPGWPAAFTASRPAGPSAAASWRFSGVTLDMPNTLDCFADAGIQGFPCSSGATLREQLRDPAVTHIALTGDIRFDPEAWPPEEANLLKQGKGLNVSHTVEIRGCRTDPFQPVVIDFANLPQSLYVFGKMVFSGNARLVNSWPSPRRANLWQLIGALSVENDGIISFDGVEIRGATPTAFHNFEDPFWSIHTDPAYVPAPSDFIRLNPPPMRDRDVLLVNYTFVKSRWVRASQGTSGVVAVQGTGYWQWLNAPVIWEGSPATGNVGRPSPLALGLGIGLGGGGALLALAGVAFWLSRQRREREEAAKASTVADTTRKGSGPYGSTQGRSGFGGSAGPGGGTDGPLQARWGSGFGDHSTTVLSKGHNSSIGTEERIEEARQQLIRRAGGANSVSSGGVDQVVLLELLGEGSFGKVYKALWKGTDVAVKTMVLPSGMSGQEKREKMAIMETAISSSLSHPNIVHTYTYAVHPVRGNAAPQASGLAINGQSIALEASQGSFGEPGAVSDSGVHSWEVRLILEYCDRGTMREALNRGAFRRPDGSRDLAGVLASALDVGRAMVFLHENQIVHADLKARNVLLKSTGTDPRGFTAKVGDFGLSIRMDPGATHISNLFQGTMTHMAPETLDLGRISRASDVYAFGILLYELYTGESAFKGIPKAMLGYEVVRLNRRPVFPPSCPFEYQLLAVRCWESDPGIRPSFEQVVEELNRMQRRIAEDGTSLLPADTPLAGRDPPGVPPPTVAALHARLAMPIAEEGPGSGFDSGGVDMSLATGASLPTDLTPSPIDSNLAAYAMPFGGPLPGSRPPPKRQQQQQQEKARQQQQQRHGKAANEVEMSSGISGASYEPSATTFSTLHQAHLEAAAAAEAAAAEAAVAAVRLSNSSGGNVLDGSAISGSGGGITAEGSATMTNGATALSYPVAGAPGAVAPHATAAPLPVLPPAALRSASRSGGRSNPSANTTPTPR